MQQGPASWDRPLTHVAVTVDQVWDVRALSLKTQNIHPYVELFVGNRQYETEVVEHVRCVSGGGHQQTSGSGPAARTPRSASLVARLFSPFSAGPFSPNHSGNHHHQDLTAASKGVVEEVSERVGLLPTARADLGGSGLLPRSLPAKIGQRFVVGYLPRHEPGLSDLRHAQAPLEISIVLRDAGEHELGSTVLGRGHYVVQLGHRSTASRTSRGTCVDLALSSPDAPGGASGFVAATYEGALGDNNSAPQDVQGLSERVADMSVVTGFVRLFVESLDQPPGERTAAAATAVGPTLRHRKEAFWDRVEQDDYGPVIMGARGLTMSSGFARGLEERERRVEGGAPVHGERISSCAALKPGLRIRSDADGVGTVLGWVGEDGVLVAGLTNDPEVELGQLLPGYVYGPSMRDMLRWRSSIASRL